MLKVNKLIFKSLSPSLNEIAKSMEVNCELHKIEILNWVEFPYKPEVGFRIGHTGTSICLQYIVNEQYIRAKYLLDNESVWTDSCVEFFIAPVNDGTYYNFEFNCIGTTLLGFGNGGNDREMANSNIISKIKRNSSLGNKAIENSEGNYFWSITIEIPIESFHKHSIKTLAGQSAKANFYKCGDELKEPHFLSWNTIGTPTPNFHVPEYFGELHFE